MTGIRMPARDRVVFLRERDGNDCSLCGFPVPSRAATVEHVIPRSRGGRDMPENWRLAHKRCNAMKADMTFTEFQALVGRLAHHLLPERKTIND